MARLNTISSFLLTLGLALVLRLPRDGMAVDQEFNITAYMGDAFELPDYQNSSSFEQHPCRRKCQSGESLVCYYRLVLQEQENLNAKCQECQWNRMTCDATNCLYMDGVPQTYMLVNGQFPAPPIEVCENDVIVADVINHLAEETTMHWHGLQMHRTPSMDGAPLITQYPLAPGGMQRYAFPADRHGTVWYHSHWGWQRALGVAGTMIIRRPLEADPFSSLYDYDLTEHALMVQDLMYNGKQEARNIIVNGKGRNHLTPWRDEDTRHNYERLTVEKGKRYRFRVIHNGIGECPVKITVDQHEMLVIATDGEDLQPTPATSISLTSAERIDFILEANQANDNYWIRIEGLYACARSKLYQRAVLHYSIASEMGMPQVGLQRTLGNVNAVHVNILADDMTQSKGLRSFYVNEIPTVGLRSLIPLPWPAPTKFQTYYKSFGVTRINGSSALHADHITFQSPRKALLLEADPQEFCNLQTLQAAGINCIESFCRCTNVVRLPLNQPTEMVVTNLMASTHPYHLHGYSFRLVGQGSLNSVEEVMNIKNLDEQGLLYRVPNDYPAVVKDTVQIPPFGYVIIRFISNNPGYWLFHCHIERHALGGMAGVMEVADE